jgi:hypothetical protein
VLRAMTIFGTTWADLTLDDVQRFLDGADDEPLLWEAKGTRLDKAEVRRQVCGFANSHEGGYLILGAAPVENDARTCWRLDGVTFPDEPHTWISNVVADAERGVRPRPDFDVAAWRAPQGNVAVVHVRPTSTPPCITNGTVYERVPGKTPPIQDPNRLADLFARGDVARRDAETRALRSTHALLKALARTDQDAKQDMRLERVHSAEFAHPATFVRSAVGIAATGNPPDIAGRLFRDDTLEPVWQALRNWPSNAPDDHREPTTPQWSQEALLWRQDELGPVRTTTLVRASWDGSVAIGRRLNTAQADPTRFVDAEVRPAWSLADQVLTHLKGYGDIYLAVVAVGKPFVDEPELEKSKPPRVLLQRGPLGAGMDESQLASLSRELCRSAGYYSPEPAG